MIFWHEDGFIVVNKAIGETSSDVVQRFKRKLGCKVGHAGTLDPAACGVLVLGVDDGTKFLPYLREKKCIKEYRFGLLFGVRTNTSDLDGEVVEESLHLPTREEVAGCFSEFIGEIEQVPSKFSAIKIDGRHAYDLARRNIAFEVPARRVNVYSLDFDEDPGLAFETYGYFKKDIRSDYVPLIVKSSSGLYVRTLAEDIARRLGSVGVVVYLQRSMCSGFDLSDLGKQIQLDVLKERYENVLLSQVDIAKLYHGVRIKTTVNDGVYAAVCEAGRFCGMVEACGGVIFSLRMVKN